METHINSAEDWLEDCLAADKLRETVVKADGHTDQTDQHISEHRHYEHKDGRIASKPHSTPLTLKWLEDNYELAEGVCIPRSALYVHYLDFCLKNDSNPVNAASFGKIIRQQFPHITTRRLGTRGQSKYHYYGIGIKESSPYYEVMYSKKGVQNCNDGRKENVKQIVAYSPRSKLGTLLPEFPDVKELTLPQNVAQDKVTTFVMMYRTHCQRILDTVIRANFDEVQSFLLHFWQGMPQHIVPILGTTVIVNLVGVCDSILYKAISGVLMPTVLQPLPDSLTQVIRNFARQLDEWLRLAMEGLPELLREQKFDLARRFAQTLKRQTSLNHLCQASRTVIHSGDITGQMLDDWANVDLNSICKQTLYTMDHYSERDHYMIVSLYQEFESLLEEQAALESYTEWLDSMVERCVIKPSSNKPGTLRRIARQFLLMWSCFGTRVIRDMTLHSAPSFGSFHLLHLMFDDYVLYLVENLHSQERAAELLRVIKGEQTHVENAEDILPYPVTTSLHKYTQDLGGDVTSPVVTPSVVHDRQTVITDTREAYASAQSYSSQLTPRSHQGSSPGQSPSMLSYDTRMDVNMTSHSPCSDVSMTPNTMNTTTAPPVVRTGYNDTYYGKQTNNTNQTDISSGYAYMYGQPQHTYGREYGNTADWTDMYRYGHTGHLVTGARPADYSNFGQSRSGYDMTTYTYDNSHQNQGQGNEQMYQMYTTPNDYYGNKDVMEAADRKRRAHDDTAAISAKRTFTNDYDGYTLPTEYVRA